MNHKVPADLSKFVVITVISNPCRFKRRYELYHRFAEMCHHAGVKLITVEQAFGLRDFMVTHDSNPNHLQIRSTEELWIKENLINLGIKHALTLGEIREVAWIDADCRPARTPKDWFKETWHQLQHYEFVQMWEKMLDLDLNFNPLGPYQSSFMANYVKHGCPSFEQMKEIEASNDIGYTAKVFGRPGLAWAANIDALNKVGGLIDYAILGASDFYMAHGLVGSMETARSEYAHGPYMNKLLEWQARAQRWIKRDVGYVSGLVYHDYHGPKINRGYGTRGKILKDNQYNPETDIKYDAHGQLQLETWSDRQIKLRDQIRAYFKSRNEDHTG